MKVTNLNYAYDNHIILQDISFTLASGSINLLLGPNGAGKSTLLELLAYNQKYKKYIHINSNDTISFLPQTIKERLFLPISVNELLNYNQNNKRKYIQQNLLSLIEWNKIKDMQILNLSEGNKKKIFLIMTLLYTSSYIILDEPTAYLDIDSQKIFYQILNEIKQKENVTIIFSSHELHAIHSNINQVLCLNKTIYTEQIQSSSQDYSIYLHKHCNNHMLK